MSESSSDMMDLEDGVESTPGLLGERMIVPFSGAHQLLNDSSNNKQQQQQNCCKPNSGGQQGLGVGGGGGTMNNNLQQRHNSALAVSIETDVWLLGKSLFFQLAKTHTLHQKFPIFLFFILYMNKKEFPFKCVLQKKKK